MIRADHIIFCAYGFWLPNDPRGSWSDWVGSWELLRHGSATGISDRRSRAHDPHDATARLAAKQALKYPPVTFTGEQAREIARAFGGVTERFALAVHACAIMPEHVHMIVKRGSHRPEYLAGEFKGKATSHLTKMNLHPLAAYAQDEIPPTPWAPIAGCRIWRRRNPWTKPCTTWNRTRSRPVSAARRGAG